MRWLMLIGIQFSIARARNVSVAAICIDFPLTKYGSTWRVTGFGRSTHVGYITVKHHQGVRMIMANFPRRAVLVHPTIQQRHSSTTCFLMRAVYALKDSICLTRCSPSLELWTLLVLKNTTNCLLSNRPLCTPVVRRPFLKVWWT